MKSGGQFAVAAGVLAIGVLVLAGSFFLPPGAGYAQVGPALVPRVVGVVLIALGGFLLREVMTGGFRGVDEEAEEHLPMDWAAFAWVSGGIIAYGLLVEHAGFVFASAVLFVAVARGFLSRRWVLNIVVGLVLAVVIYVLFNYGLGLTLPPGLLKGIL